MKVTDLNGCPIEVTDLNEAIRITKRYKKYRHKDESYSDYDKKQNVYWTDIHEKLTTIKGRIKQQLNF